MTNKYTPAPYPLKNLMANTKFVQFTLILCLGLCMPAMLLSLNPASLPMHALGAVSGGAVLFALNRTGVLKVPMEPFVTTYVIYTLGMLLFWVLLMMEIDRFWLLAIPAMSPFVAIAFIFYLQFNSHRAAFVKSETRWGFLAALASCLWAVFDPASSFMAYGALFVAVIGPFLILHIVAGAIMESSVTEQGYIAGGEVPVVIVNPIVIFPFTFWKKGGPNKSLVATKSPEDETLFPVVMILASSEALVAINAVRIAAFAVISLFFVAFFVTTANKLGLF